MDELRSIFSLSQAVAERMRLFRIERVSKVAADETPTLLTDGARMITHVLPLSAFAGIAAVDVRPLEQNANALINTLQVT